MVINMFFCDKEFSDEQRAILSSFISNIDGNVFALRNLPEVVKGALFSKYSRSVLGLKSLLLKEFIEKEDSEFFKIASEKLLDISSQEDGIKRAKLFYERVLDGFGDDSIGELGGAHVAIENCSMLAAKFIEDSRIGGSPLEKSTRYVYFDQKIKGEYRFYREPVIMTSAYKALYLDTNNMLFNTYSKLIAPTTELIEKMNPKSADVSSGVYSSSIRAKVLDCLRGLLPLSTLTNVGVFGNGRFWQSLILRLNSSDLAEVKSVGSSILEELQKVIPAFVSRADPSHRHCAEYIGFAQSVREQIKSISKKYECSGDSNKSKESVVFIDGNHDDLYKVAASILFPFTNQSMTCLIDKMKKLSNDELSEIFEVCSSMRENRRHKSPRALECADFTFDIIADFGAYRDLQRHRILTQERQILSTEHGFSLPDELRDTQMEKDFKNAMYEAAEAHAMVYNSFPEEAQYMVPMAYNVRWFFKINLRSLQWLCELRSQPQGHINYRRIAQKMAELVIKFNPMYESFFKFVNYENAALGRLSQESRKSSHS